MFYVDTSVIAAYYYPEPLSNKAGLFLTTHFRPAISPLTELELFSAMSRKVREGTLDRASGNRIIAKFLSHFDDFFYKILPVESHHYRLVRDWLGQFSALLRSLDAIHIAVASMEGATIVTADRGLAKSTESLTVDIFRVHFHFTPTSASWLNQIEIWLGILSRKTLKGASFSGKESLAAAIQAFTARHK